MPAWLPRIVVMVSTACSAMLLVFVAGADHAFSSTEATAVATLALLAALPLVDSVIFGGSVRPETGGMSLGLSVGFFVRQGMSSPELAQGASRVLGTAFVVSVGLCLWRWFRRRQRA